MSLHDELVSELVSSGLNQYQLTLLLKLVSAMSFGSGQIADNRAETAAERRRAWDRERKRRHRAAVPDSEWQTISQVIFNRDGHQCRYCGATEKLQVDHLVPMSRGGSHALENLATCCGSCNTSKGSRLLSEWLPTRDGKQTMSVVAQADKSASNADAAPLLTSSLSLETEGSKGTSEKGRKKKVSGCARGTRLTSADQLSLTDLDFALSAGLTEDEARSGWVEFLDYWVTIPGQRGVKLDWSATWRNNVRRVVKFKAGKPNAKTTGVIASADKLIDRIAAFDRPAQPQLSICGGTDAPDVRLLPEGGRERP